MLSPVKQDFPDLRSRCPELRRVLASCPFETRRSTLRRASSCDLVWSGDLPLRAETLAGFETDWPGLRRDPVCLSRESGGQRPEGCREPFSGEARRQCSEERREAYPVGTGLPNLRGDGGPCPGWDRTHDAD
jgi:hypothetical protein